MRRTLRKTLNRVDREKCDIAYVGKKLEMELANLRWKDCASDSVKYRMYCSAERGGAERFINLLTCFDDEIIEWVLPGGWILRYHEKLEPEANLVYQMFDKHYNRGDR